MSYGFEIYDTAGDKIADQDSIGLVVIHEEILTVATTNVVFVAKNFQFITWDYISNSANGEFANIVVTDVTPGGAPPDTYTLECVQSQAAGQSNAPVVDIHFRVLAGDYYGATLQDMPIS